MTTKTHNSLRPALLALLLCGSLVFPALAADVELTLNIDCYDGDVDKAGSSDSITVEFWGDGVCNGPQKSDHGLS